MPTLIDVSNLKTEFHTQDGIVHAVNGVSFAVDEGETLGLVGESGCGKSVSMLSVMRLIPMPPGKISSGQVLFQGQDLLKLSDEEMRQIRGNKISMIFQEPMTSLSPLHTIGDQIMEAIELHQRVSRQEAEERAVVRGDRQSKSKYLPDRRCARDSVPRRQCGRRRWCHR